MATSTLYNVPTIPATPAQVAIFRKWRRVISVRCVTGMSKGTYRALLGVSLTGTLIIGSGGKPVSTASASDWEPAATHDDYERFPMFASALAPEGNTIGGGRTINVMAGSGRTVVMPNIMNVADLFTPEEQANMNEWVAWLMRNPDTAEAEAEEAARFAADEEARMERERAAEAEHARSSAEAKADIVVDTSTVSHLANRFMIKHTVRLDWWDNDMRAVCARWLVHERMSARAKHTIRNACVSAAHSHAFVRGLAETCPEEPASVSRFRDDVRRAGEEANADIRSFEVDAFDNADKRWAIETVSRQVWAHVLYALVPVGVEVVTAVCLWTDEMVLRVRRAYHALEGVWRAADTALAGLAQATHDIVVQPVGLWVLSYPQVPTLIYDTVLFPLAQLFEAWHGAATGVAFQGRGPAPTAREGIVGAMGAMLLWILVPLQAFYLGVLYSHEVQENPTMAQLRQRYTRIDGTLDNWDDPITVWHGVTEEDEGDTCELPLYQVIHLLMSGELAVTVGEPNVEPPFDWIGCVYLNVPGTMLTEPDVDRESLLYVTRWQGLVRMVRAGWNQVALVGERLYVGPPATAD